MPTYTGISSEAFRHPLDQQAEQALRSVPGFDMVARRFVEFVYERPQFVYLMGNAVQVGPRQYSSIYQIFRECVRDLDIQNEPTLFVSQTPTANAFALGQDMPSIVLNSGLLDLLSAAELRTVIAHELGHIKCGHTTLTRMAMWTINLVLGISSITFGLSSLVSTSLIMAFYEWFRKAELSADRAALLVVDDLDLIVRTMMQMAGGSTRYINELSLAEFIKQSERYQELDQDNLNQVYKFLLYNNLVDKVFLTHPFTIERIRYIQEWSVSEEYRQIRAGHYDQATAEGAVNVKAETASDANQSEAETLRRKIQQLQEEIDRVKRSTS